MTRYRILTKHEPAFVLVSENTVLSASPLFSWAVLGSFETVRAHAERNGWTVVPEPEEPHYIDFRGTRYELSWRSGRLARISIVTEKGLRDITFNQLPREIQDHI